MKNDSSITSKCRFVILDLCDYPTYLIIIFYDIKIQFNFFYNFIYRREFTIALLSYMNY